MLLHDLILRSADRNPDKIALRHGDQAISYADLSEAIQRGANGLTAAGLLRHDRVAVYLPKRPEAVVAYFSAALAGGVFVPINPVLKAAQVAHILRDSNARIVITSADRLAAIEPELHDCPGLCTIVLCDESTEQPVKGVPTVPWEHLANGEESARRHDSIDSDMAAILYTSGSTGKPKGVVLSHGNMVAGALSVAEYLENTERDVILAVLPFSFDAGFSQLTTAFSVGATAGLMDYLVPNDVIKTAKKFSATGLGGVPPLWNQLARLEWPEDVRACLRYITNTGGAMPTATLASLRERLPQTRVYLMYGLTESFRSTYLPPDQLDQRPTSMGKAIPNVEVLVVREDGSPCGPGEPGELVHRGALVSLGYWNDPERTAERFRPAPGQPDGLPFPEIAVWSGDTVVKDEQGFLYFVGRKDDMIKSSGYRISPTEVEEVVYATGLVHECAALGIPHVDLGQAVVVACQCSDSGDSVRDAIISACRRLLPGFMVPKEIVFREALPRNPNGKIDRKRLCVEFEDLFQDVEDP